ncbi:MAG: hypothetical protein A3F31_03565 [Candidatus Levybacteria bacterium RIFCSPHIGHO2_12_FULL_38_12]|nr:MAG: hypothetical protein A2770_00125 [Candidatus Levybacteria bacterium RIFCSPHIGHO2_01_FULL_38_12]OGH22365.1 MAG: hypothetical protein A3D75_01770 [Candidatus Levybacteria bacterium RIFCSPHIGHO2_02_FULL_37_18]OGH23109.1 MAG: hypothetical protein A3F31_03565 [Candidatus Levybacteria bacterium RIFCSPHIGHO2_12_FULL_38_12]OGH34563.1 MAG: hypothetical protein A3A47_00080 [Candidatus Levybacteria bacterium RIFCSPLOWO2_01_FULL_37_20]OGH43679.1 MAG: hypothetical protein A3J14_03735 [Candidatus Lev
MIQTLETPLKSKATTLHSLNEEKINEMKQILQAQGVRFEPKTRKVEIPLITDQTLSSLFPDESKGSAQLAISVLGDYLTKDVIIDQWGNNHAARKKWQEDMMIKYSGTFKEVYYDRNLLRSSHMTSAI